MANFLSKYELAIVSFLILLGVVGLAFVLDWLIKFSSPETYTAIGTMLLALVAIPALFFAGLQARSLLDAFNLEKRPYLYVFLVPLEINLGPSPDSRNIFGGGKLHFRNEGPIPASDIKAEYVVASDVNRDIALEEWFQDALGGFPHVRTVYPRQNDQYVYLHPTIGSLEKRPKVLFVGAVISYAGLEPQKRYWLKFSRLYSLNVSEIEGRKFGSTILELEDFWDRNCNFDDLPEIKKPDWDQYLSKSYIKREVD